MKRSLTSSWIFQHSALFYPAGPPAADQGSYPALAGQQLRALEQAAQAHLQTVTQLHQQYAPTLNSNLKLSLPPRVKGVLLLENMGQPTGRSAVNAKDEIEISMDVRLLQANFKGSLVAVARRPAFSNLDLTNISARGENKTDDQLVSEFLQFKKHVSEAPAGNAYADLLGNDKRWFQMVELADQGNAIAAHYSGTLLFLLAHEIGHFALGHLSAVRGPNQCEIFQAEEIDADLYATALLTLAYGRTGSFGRMIPYNYEAELIGVETFFDHAYERIGFREVTARAGECEYPPLSERKRRTVSMRDSILKAYDQQLFTVPAVRRNQ